MITLDAIKADPRRRNLAVLAAIALVALALALGGVVHESALTGNKYPAETVFPKLPDQVRKIARVHIVSKAHGTLDVVFNPQRGWVLPQHSNYRASFEQLRATVVGLAALQTIEPKTARPEWYGAIAVDAPPKGSGTFIELMDDRGRVLASLIAGKSTDIGDASGAIGLYVRKPDETQSWLVRSVFEPKSDAGDWLDKNVIDIDRARIAEADITPPTGPAYVVKRAKPSDPDFAIANIPAGREEAYQGAGDSVAAAITGFSFDDVRPATDFDFGNAPRVVFRTFDGLTVTVQIVPQGQDFWATVYAEGAPGKPDAEREARTIDAHANGWAYKLPDYKGKLFMTTLDTLLKPAKK